jgi:mannose-6-phosphate isomerase-like protein (cupin superfamily)
MIVHKIPMKTLSLLTAGSCLLLTALWAQQRTPPKQHEAWAPKPISTPKYVAPQKPLTKLSDLLTKHKGQQNWSEVVVNDDHLHGAYIMSAPGTKTLPRFHPDTREWWVVMDGQIRFEIEGQEPFVASKGWLVQVPYRNVYTMETVGEKPSLRWEVNIAHAQTLYPKAEKPPTMPGFNWIPVKVAGQGVYDRGNKPYLIFDEIAAKVEKQPRKSGGARFINDDRAVANVIYGYAKDLPPLNPNDKGHYHPECAEFWIILAGQIDYKIENQPEFVANVGDIVYAPKFTWHRPRFAGDGPSCRLAMNGYPDIAHLFDDVPQETASR